MNKKLMAYFLVPVLLSCSAFSYDVNSINVESVSFDTERIVVKFSSDKYQEIESSVEPEFIDYRYNIIDVNFDGFKDLIVSEINGLNSLSFVYLYNSNKNRFNDDVFFESSGLRVNENEKYICSATSNDSESTVIYLYREKDISIYELEHESGLATLFRNEQKKNIDKEIFNDKLNLCVMNVSI